VADMVVSAMQENPYSQSLEARVLSATPMELVVILYDEAIQAVRAARTHLASKNFHARGRAVSKAVSILLELSRSLNFEAGDRELSKRLAGVYEFMRSSLLEANFRQTEDGLATTERLLVSLREAWFAVSAQPSSSSSAPETPVTAAPAFPWGVIGDAMSPSRCWSA
jgi:flagellar secretion chaperone FliS